MRADEFAYLASLLIEDSPLSLQERASAIQAAGIRADWSDNELNIYEQYRT